MIYDKMLKKLESMTILATELKKELDDREQLSEKWGGERSSQEISDIISSFYLHEKGDAEMDKDELEDAIRNLIIYAKGLEIELFRRGKTDI